MELAHKQEFYLHKPIDLIILQSVSSISKSQSVTADIGTSIFWTLSTYSTDRHIAYKINHEPWIIIILSRNPTTITDSTIVCRV